MGTIINQNLSWTNQTNSIAKKLKKANGALSKVRHYLLRKVRHYLLRKVRHYLLRKELCSVYYALFHSHLICMQSKFRGIHYLLIVAFTNFKSLPFVFSHFADWKSHSQPLFNQLSIKTVDILIFHLNICLVHQSLNNQLSSGIIETLCFNYIPNTRNMRESTL